MQPEIIVAENAESLYSQAEQEWTTAMLEAIQSRGQFLVALAGGSTPRRLYERLGPELPWDKTQIFFGDERMVPADDEESNYRMAFIALLCRVQAHVHRIPTELGAYAAAAHYEKTILEVCGPDARFDLILLGMGADGHTASLFPGTHALSETSRLVVANAVPQLATTRITFTYPLLNAARRVLFLVEGKGKAEMVKRVLQGTTDPAEFPIQGVAPQNNGSLKWILDRNAASQLSPGV